MARNFQSYSETESTHEFGGGETMRRIPFLEKPTAQMVLEYTGIPCYTEVKRIILAECEKNNEILMVGDVSGHPSTTHVMIDFVEKPQNPYDNLKTGKCGDEIYQYLMFCDNNGACKINFGRRVE